MGGKNSSRKIINRVHLEILFTVTVFPPIPPVVAPSPLSLTAAKPSGLSVGYDNPDNKDMDINRILNFISVSLETIPMRF
jgi:hypothetical protein